MDDDYQTRRVALKNRVRRRGIFLLPNLFTTAALFAGFYAIVQAMNVNFDYAAIAIFVAMVLDGLDGRVARMTHTQSAFGAEYDSLSDMVYFGAAPALIMYEWVLRDLGKLGWIAAFVYVAGARAAARALQHAARGRRQALVHRTAEPVGGGDRRRPRLGGRRPGLRSRAAALDRLGRDDLRRPHDGQQPEVLELQGVQPEEERAVHRDLSRWR